MKQKLKSAISNYKVVSGIFLVFVIISSIQSYLDTYDEPTPEGITYNEYNNYTIFEKSFYHLKDGKDLYVHHPEEHYDLYKYTPTFSVFFGTIAIFPDWIGLHLWNIINAFLLLFAIYYLPKLDNYQKGLVLLICLIELLTCMQNEQSNGLMAGLIILSFGLLERHKYLWATFCLVFSVFIKLFGIVGFALFLLYPKKLKLFAYSAMWIVILFLVPLIFIGIDQYKLLMTSFADMLSNDHSTSLGYSVMGWLESWFGIGKNKMLITGIGAIIFMIPFIKIKEYKNIDFRFLALSSILLWVIIFNHKAESPTFIIAMSGVALWFIRGRKNWLTISLFVAAFLLTSISPTDLFPRYIRNEFVKPYLLKALPCILIWAVIIYDMLILKNSKPIENQDTKS